MPPDVTSEEDVLTPYEAQRQRTIELNKRKLAELGLLEESEKPATPPRRKGVKRQAVRKLGGGDGEGEEVKETRRSSRLSGKAPDYTARDLRDLEDPPDEDTIHKRKTSNGVHIRRIVHGRVYDSVDGSSCHQCRQKTLDPKIKCKNTFTHTSETGETYTTECPILFDERCLLSRYQERKEDIGDDWKCPKCRGKCNCSICLRKKGKSPTGIMFPEAQAMGFSSVEAYMRALEEGSVKRPKGSEACRRKSGV
ncbi:hypothetical protein HK104_003863 [Borealophlyctis nickersoniae]|nr:hypothetical protein HK104_003863 [Borealophlyctis nickersoniae]